MKRRVVVTGLGMVSPLGNDLASSWQGIIEGRSGIGPLTHIADAYLERFTTKIAGEVKDFDITADNEQFGKYRVSGNMRPADDRIITPEFMEQLLKEICFPVTRWDKYLQNHDLDFAHEIPGLARFRCNNMYNYHGMGAVLLSFGFWLERAWGRISGSGWRINATGLEIATALGFNARHVVEGSPPFAAIGHGRRAAGGSGAACRRAGQ